MAPTYPQEESLSTAALPVATSPITIVPFEGERGRSDWVLDTLLEECAVALQLLPCVAPLWLTRMTSQTGKLLLQLRHFVLMTVFTMLTEIEARAGQSRPLSPRSRHSVAASLSRARSGGRAPRSPLLPVTAVVEQRSWVTSADDHLAERVSVAGRDRLGEPADSAGPAPRPVLRDHLGHWRAPQSFVPSQRRPSARKIAARHRRSSVPGFRRLAVLHRLMCTSTTPPVPQPCSARRRCRWSPCPDPVRAGSDQWPGSARPRVCWIARSTMLSSIPWPAAFAVPRSRGAASSLAHNQHDDVLPGDQAGQLRCSSPAGRKSLGQGQDDRHFGVAQRTAFDRLSMNTLRSHLHPRGRRRRPSNWSTRSTTPAFPASASRESAAICVGALAKDLLRFHRLLRRASSPSRGGQRRRE